MRKFLAAVGLCLGLVCSTVLGSSEPAGATLWYLNWDWYGGLVQSNFYTADYTGGYCTSGPHYYSWANNHYYQAMPRHCTEAPAFAGCGVGRFHSKYVQSNDNKYDCGQIGYATNPSYYSADVVIADIGSSSTPTQTNGLYNYCRSVAGYGQNWNCTSFLGGGTLQNYPYNGRWNYITANTWPYAGMYVCKSGAHSGTSCGTVSSSTPSWSVGQGYQTPVYTVDNLDNCGSAEGDSGAPVVATDYTHMLVTNEPVHLAGMLIGGQNTSVASAGNGCYSAGKPYSWRMGFISDADIRSAFHLYQLQAVQW